ncbi:MAG: insulinase family protein, partial [Ginsengibacter sp.]
MNLYKFLFLFVFTTATFSLSAQTDHSWKQATSNGYTYKYVNNDPIKARFYTLKNGLTVILSENKKEPRIAANIAVRAGSNTDPRDHTGLAHYLEHILFKGTDKFGTLNWEKEKPYIDSITNAYEKYTTLTNPEERKAAYAEIDRLSGEASKFSIANEYDKLMSNLGSQGTNAHTWFEETVYKEDIPSNSMDKF